MQQTRELVAAEVVRAEQVRGAGPFEHAVQIGGVGRVGRELRAEQRDQGEHADDDGDASHVMPSATARRRRGSIARVAMSTTVLMVTNSAANSSSHACSTGKSRNLTASRK